MVVLINFAHFWYMAIKKSKKNLILLIDSPVAAALSTIDALKKNKEGYRYMLLYPSNMVGKENLDVIKKFKVAVPCNFNSPDSIIAAILPHRDELLGAYCRSEVSIPRFQKVIPHIPYLKTPTSESLEWSVNKYKMRKRFFALDKSITPKFMLVKDQTKASLKEIEKKISFPLVIKPVGLAQSLLVNIVYHRQELEKNLSQVFRKVKQAYKDSSRSSDPQVIVEEFIEGNMYSIDGYINSRGKVYHCPIVQVKTGREIGFDDFFGYQQMTPTNLTKGTVEEAEKVTSKGVRALGLRSTIFHAELIKNDKGFKIVEIGPRIGGFRADLYEMSYGINHRANAVYITIPKVPKIKKRVKGHSAAFKFFAKKEGRISNITGMKKAKELKSFKSITINKKVGDRAKFAKNGGKSVFNITLFNKDRANLLADIRRLEQGVKIEVKTGRK
ncbi:MAG: biotin carboxylase [Candidatus Paceibacteria bacterium]|jgi:biotin carboxylase